jgi:uncharacterized protein
MSTVFLLVLSNVFMTIAWYAHLKHTDSALWKVILISWLIALLEYCFHVPANRMGIAQFSVTQLKIMQEAISISVFVVFALLYFQEVPRWNHMAAFVLIIAAVALVFMPSGAQSV